MTKKVKPYLDHEALGISFPEYVAIFGIRGMLANRLLIPTKGTRAIAHRHTFNMSLTGEVYECGTIGCIGGNIAITLGKTSYAAISDYVSNSKGALERLFYPYGINQDALDTIPISATIKAIDRYLQGAQYPWGPKQKAAMS